MNGEKTIQNGESFCTATIKEKMRGQRFSFPEETVEAFKSHVLELSSSDWSKCVYKWFELMQKCIDLNGVYFEKQ